MIRVQNAQTAIDLAQEFDRRGLGIGCKEDSILHSLHSAATIDFIHPTASAPNGYMPTAEDIVAESSIVPEGADRSAHDSELEEATIVVADGIRQQVSFAKNTVRPLVAALVEAVESGLKAMPLDATFNPEIIRVTLPQPMLANSLGDLVSQYSSVTYFPLSQPIGLDALDDAGVEALLMTGSKAVDGDIAAWISTKGISFFTNVYRVVFTRDAGVDGSFTSIIDKKTDGVDAALACFLMAKNLFDNPPSGVEMSLNEWKRVVGDVLAQSGLRLAQASEQVARQEQAGQLILTYSKDAVHVVGSVYDRWVDGGGQPAALFGNVLSDNPTFYAGAINEGASEYKGIWENLNRLLTMTLLNRRYRDTMELLRFKSEALLADHLDACFGQLANGSTLSFETPVVKEAMQRINTFIDGITIDQLGDGCVWPICTALVAGCIFYYASAQQILEGIDVAAKANPDAPVEEAALISVIEYIVDWVVDQLYVYDL